MQQNQLKNANRFGEYFIVAGIVLHIVYVSLLFAGVWANVSTVLILIFAVSTLLFISEFMMIKKKPSTLWATILVVNALFLTYYLVSFIFIIGAILTMIAAKKQPSHS
jgi:hypothetical protein